jgi:P27 family predicted phage terminase small subunit
VLQVLDGTRASRLVPAASAADSGRPVAPSHLGKEARGEWDRLVAELEARRVLTPADGPSLALYCDAWDRARQARERLDEDGLVTKTGQGALKVHPLVVVETKARDQMLRVLVEFGLTPSSRARVAAQAEPEADALATFLAARKQC